MDIFGNLWKLKCVAKGALGDSTSGGIDIPSLRGYVCRVPHHHTKCFGHLTV